MEDLVPSKEEIPAKKDDPVIELLNRPSIKFSDIDYAMDIENVVSTIPAPKDIETLEDIAKLRHADRKAQEALEEEEDKLTITGDVLSSEDLNIEVLS